MAISFVTWSVLSTGAALAAVQAAADTRASFVPPFCFFPKIYTGEQKEYYKESFEYQDIFNWYAGEAKNARARERSRPKTIGLVRVYRPGIILR